MEKTLEIHLQEERERIARNIEGQLSFYLVRQVENSTDANWSLGYAQALAFIAGRVKNNFDFESATMRYTNR
jgi:hypothetical protein